MCLPFFFHLCIVMFSFLSVFSIAEILCLCSPVNRTPPTCRARCRNTRPLKRSCLLTKAESMPCRSQARSCWMESIMPQLRFLVTWKKSALSGKNCWRPLSSKV